jgi:hypothetical protein
MKKITLLFILFVSVFSYAQQSTTLEEYNYMTKGYKVSIDSGLDIKKGYRVEDAMDIPIGNYRFVFKSLVRDNNTLAGLILISTSNLWGNVYYTAIPVNNSELSVAYFQKLIEWDKEMLNAYSVASTSFMFDLYKDFFNSTHSIK